MDNLSSLPNWAKKAFERAENFPLVSSDPAMQALFITHCLADIPHFCSALKAARLLAEQRRVERNAAFEAGLVLEAALAKAKSALEFYADEDNWSSCGIEHFDLLEFPDADGDSGEGQREVEFGIDIVWDQADPGYGYAQKVLAELRSEESDNA